MLTVAPGLAAKSPQKITHSVTTEPLFYTIQIASYNHLTDALPLYKKIKKELPAAEQQFLRIITVSGYAAIRLGKTDTRQELNKTLSLVKRIIPKAHIMHAYYRPPRILFPRGDITPVGKQMSEPVAQPGSQSEEVAPANPKSSKTAPEPATVPPTPAATVPKPDSKAFMAAMLKKYLSSKSASTKKAARFARQAAQKIVPTPNCLTANCHANLTKVKLPHAPVSEARCSACHIQTAQNHPSGQHNDFKLPDTDDNICQKCHRNQGRGQVVHPPFKQGKCLACHDPHGTDNKNLLSVTIGDEKPLCQKCHDLKKDITGFKFMHGPADLGTCTFCHNPHAATEKFLLRKPAQQLCLTCHTSMAKNLSTAPYIHEPVKNKDCLICHRPHGSKFPSSLRYEAESLCFSCHPDIQDKQEHSRTKHVGLYLEKKCGTCHMSHYSKYDNLLIKQEEDLCLTCHQSDPPIKGFKPLDIASELKDKEYLHGPIKEGKCTGCHDPHGSDNPSLMTAPMPTSFYAPYSSPKEYALCFTCHDPALLSERETSKATKFRNGTRNLHSVHVAKEHKGRTCKACHQNHASNGPKLISKNGAKFGTWHISIDFSLSKTGGSCTPSCHRYMAYDRQNPKDNSAKNRKYGKYYVDYKSKQ